MSFRGPTPTQYVAMENSKGIRNDYFTAALRSLSKTLFPKWHAVAHAPPPYIPFFKYQPLPDPTRMIRLITIKPSPHYQWYDPEQIIVIETKVVVLKDCPEEHPFVAISYCWGNPNETSKIICDGTVMTITKSLHEALLRFRGPTKRTFWADAICINQTDDAEKTQQVRLMRDIYENASTVAVWLGDAGANSDHVLNVSEAFGNAIECSHVRDWEAFWDPTVQKEIFRHLPQLSDIGWSSVGQFLQRPWWGRMWVIQEIAVAPDAMLHCGSSSTSWSTFSNMLKFMLAVGLLESHPDNHAEKVVALMKTRDNFQNSLYQDFLAMMLRHRACSATIGKDKIFALSGLSIFPLQPDYSKTDAEIFTDAAIEMMKMDDNSLNILSVPHAPHTADRILPSWIPDWTHTPFVASLVPYNSSSTYPPFSASGLLPATDTNPPFKISLSKTTLTLTAAYQLPGGTVVATALTCPSTPWSPTLSSLISADLRLYSALVTWETISRARSNLPYITGEPHMRDVYMQTLLAGRHGHNTHELEAYRKKFAEWEESWRVWYWLFRSPLPPGLVIWICWLFGMAAVGVMYVKHMVTGWHAAPVLSMPASGSDIGSITDARDFKAAIAGRRMVRTEKGFVGLALEGAEVGDEVWLVKGARVPFLLRPEREREKRRGVGDEEDGRGAYTLVGDIYVHGVMYGEAFEQERCGEICIV
ncbi:HET-domain-containing protein [Lophium mytilinum]|uniref:HET-domain-containing protein n=1 Tax=Lophium mytilinum TaxID=390894 RepID=A0A6A6RD33_9PEZI|nr:HET-domain-containing protein [Lophium mytilinum]